MVINNKTENSSTKKARNIHQLVMINKILALIMVILLFGLSYKYLMDFLFLPQLATTSTSQKQNIDVVPKTMEKSVLIKGGQIICTTRVDLDRANKVIANGDIQKVNDISRSSVCKMVNSNTPAFIFAETSSGKVFLKIPGSNREMWANRDSTYEAEHQGFAESRSIPAGSNKFDNFINELRGSHGVITAFREGLTLWVQVPGSSEFQARGQEFADMISAWYTRAVGGVVCVRVFYGNRRTIGRTCANE
jgi:hypothetical protein